MIRLLLGIRLRALFAPRSQKQKKSDRASRGGRIALIAFLAVFVLLSYGIMLYGLFAGLAAALAQSETPWLYFTVYAIFDLLLLCVGTAFLAKSQLFEATDNEFLLSMPVPASAILLSRLLTLYLLNLGLHLLLTVPMVLAWNSYSTFGALGIVSLVLISVLLPLFALALAALLGWGLSALSRHIRNKSLMTVVASLLAIGVYMLLLNRSEQLLLSFTTHQTEIAGSLRYALPLYWIGQALAGISGRALLFASLFLLIPGVLVYLLILKTLFRHLRMTAKTVRVAYHATTERSVPAERAIFRVQMRRFVSSPTFLLNGGFGVVLQIALGVYLVAKRSVFTELVAELAAEGVALGRLLMPLAALTVGFLSSTVLITPAQIAMEGKYIWLLQSMPVSSAQILRAKLAVHGVVAIPGAIISAILCAIALPLGVFETILLLLYALAFSAFFGLLGLVENLRHPYLHWQNENQAVKSGPAVLLTMLLGMAVLILVGGMGVLTVVLAKTADAVLPASILLLLLLFAGCFGLWKWIFTRGCRIFAGLTM